MAAIWNWIKKQWKWFPFIHIPTLDTLFFNPTTLVTLIFHLRVSSFSFLLSSASTQRHFEFHWHIGRKAAHKLSKFIRNPVKWCIVIPDGPSTLQHIADQPYNETQKWLTYSSQPFFVLNHVTRQLILLLRLTLCTVQLFLLWLFINFCFFIWKYSCNPMYRSNPRFWYYKKKLTVYSTLPNIGW